MNVTPKGAVSRGHSSRPLIAGAHAFQGTHPARNWPARHDTRNGLIARTFSQVLRAIPMGLKAGSFEPEQRRKTRIQEQE
jgi:hypothetical protein